MDQLYQRKNVVSSSYMLLLRLTTATGQPVLKRANMESA